jgi:hypothetical protein
MLLVFERDSCARRYVDHSAKISQHDKYTSVWFQFNGFGTIKASATGFRGRLNSSVARFDRCAARWLDAATRSHLVRNCSSTLGPTWTPRGGANIETWECRQAKAKWGTGGYVQADVLQVPGRHALESSAHHPLQLCGRRTFYQLLVCDNSMDTNIGAPYYSDQQLFPGFMMTEYDGITRSSRSIFTCAATRSNLIFVSSLLLLAFAAPT